MTNNTFEAFGFAEPLARALTQCGYTTPTPIQVQALPPQLEGRDLLGMAETGSGKTATFLIPLLNKFAANPIDPQWKQVCALILAPTRELAVQIDQEVAKLARNMNLRRAVVLGGVSKGPQINALRRGVHILVATPGRLLDHVNMRSCDLSGVETLVIDEADRMFDMGFVRDIKKIVSLIPQKRRTALFSATMPDEIKKFAYDILHDPYRIDLSSKKIVVDRIDQKVMIVKATEKQSRLHTILNDEAASRVIVFTRTKRGADRVAGRLGMAGISASAFHGNKAQNARQRALNDFTMGHVRVLVATDIAARGIDVSNITHVINFDMPLDPETYVHRVGRTARKGTNGIAISLCDPSERQEVRAIERMMKQPLEVIDDVGGEVLPPLPRNHPSNDSEGPRRDGNHGGRGGEHRQRDGAPRGERQGHRGN
ncbi:MAG: DEAD/DEAH box helicase, partial [Proteobacteria bacterium]|nr:DEAD/DEAH box helicase [Pseudomonadota bacterium]